MVANAPALHAISYRDIHSTAIAYRPRKPLHPNPLPPKRGARGPDARTCAVGLVPVPTEEDVERILIADNARLMEILHESDRDIDRTDGIPHDEFWKRIDAKYQKKSVGRPKRKVGK